MKKVMYNITRMLGGMSIFVVSGFPVIAQASESIAYPLGFGVTASPSMEISTRHDDNIFLQDDAAPRVNGTNLVQSSWITEIAPSITLLANDGPNQYLGQYTLLAGRYHSSRDDDYVDHKLLLKSYNEFNYRNKLDLEFDYLHLHEERGTGISDNTGNVAKTPHEFDDWLIGGQYTYGGADSIGRITVEASHFDREYTNHRDITRYYDRKEDVLGGTFYYRVMPKTSLLFEAKYKDINYETTPVGVAELDGDEMRYQAGVTWEATAKTTGIAKIGKTYKNFDSSEYKDRDFTSWGVDIKWSPLSYSVVGVATSRYPVETNGIGTFVENTDFIAAWKHTWTEKISSRLNGRFVNQDYIESDRDDDIISFGIGADYQFHRSLAFAVDYDYSNRDSNMLYQDYDDNILMFTVKLGM